MKSIILLASYLTILSSHMIFANDSGYQTQDDLGNIVNSNDSYQTKDDFGNIVNSNDGYQTRDNFGNIVNRPSQ